MQTDAELERLQAIKYVLDRIEEAGGAYRIGDVAFLCDSCKWLIEKHEGGQYVEQMTLDLTG
jgi:hypothetical protein